GLLSEYAEDYKGRLLVIHNAKSVGMQNASNLGVRASQSDYISIHDDDDSWHPCFLEECTTLLEARDTAVYGGVVCQTERVVEHITIDGRIVEQRRESYMPLETVNLYRIAEGNLFAPIAFLYKREAHEEIGLFNQRYTVLGDWDFNLRFLLKYQIAVHERALAYYHWRDPAMAGIYANSVTDGIDEHHQMGSLLRNDYLREDLAANRQGLGFILNLAKPISGNSKLIYDLHRTAQQTLSSVKGIKNSAAAKKKTGSKEKAAQEVNTNANDDEGKAGKFRIRQRNRDFVALTRTRLSQASVLSVDIFDTALFRTLQQPIDLFKLMEPAAREILDLPEFPFATARFSAEQVARLKQKKAASHTEVGLEEIYDTLLANIETGPAFRSQLIETEHRAEMTVCYANPVVLKLCQEAVKQGKRLIFLSDMYLGSTFLQTLLTAAGFPPAPVIVSGEHATSKHEGGLFRILLDHLKTEPDQIVHIGDKRTADFIHPRQAGLKAVHYDVLPGRQVFASDGHPAGSFTEGNIASSLTIGIARKRLVAKTENRTTKTDQFWRQVGYEIAGPLYLGYANWIFHRCQALKIDRAYFLARDGKNLSDVFEKLCRKWGGKISTHYMYASRRLLNFARIKKLDERSLDFLMSSNPGMCVRHFFERIGFDYSVVQEDWAPLNRGIWNQPVTTDKGEFVSGSWWRTVKEMLLALEHRIVAASREERSVLERYFASIDFPSSKAAVVDVGWQASLLHSLHDLVTGKDKKSPLVGLYFGTWKKAQRVIDAGVPLESWYITQEMPKPRTWTVWECVEFVEFLFNASHPTIVGIREEAGRFEPVFGKQDFDSRQLAALEVIREYAFRYVDDFLDLHPDPIPTNALLTYLEAAFKRVLSEPRKDEARILGRMPHRGGFGDRSPLRQLANPPPRLLRRLFRRHNAQLYKQSFWKKGYLAQLTPREARKLKSS
ncbi:MAG TPA: glycosyltransferase, partial [Chthoniobacterales bacterium]